MSLEKIIEHLEKESALEIKKIEQVAQAKADHILKDAKEKATAIKEKILKTASLEAKGRKEHILTIANLEARRTVLREKEYLIETAYRKALVSFKRLDKRPYQELIKKMLLRVAKTGAGEVIISKEDKKRIPPSFIKRINKELRISGEDREISGGFILKREKIEINNSFESLLRSKREELEPKLVRILFDKGNKGNKGSKGNKGL